MAVPVIMPKLEMAQESATIVEWLVEEGGLVEKGEPLLAIETDKVTVDVEAPASGTLRGVRYAPQDEVSVTVVIAYILAPGEQLPEQACVERSPELSRELSEITRTSEATRATPVARRLAARHGLNVAAFRGTGPRGRVTKADVEEALEGAPATGAGATAASDSVRATPAARRIARERGVELSKVLGTGPQGRVQAKDVLAFAPDGVFGGLRVARVVPLVGMRRTIAERMAASSRTAPHITLVVPMDISALEEGRANLNEGAVPRDLAHVSVTALLVKAVAGVLRRHPWLNSTLRDDEIILFDEVNVGVAVALEQGLIVPVVRGVDRKGIFEIAAEVSDVAKRAREGRLTPADVAGGTFTLSNLGPFGIEQFTAIINPPQVAILAAGAARQEVVVGASGGLFVRPIVRVTLSADHRVVDGVRAAAFLRDLRETVEAPALLLS